MKRLLLLSLLLAPRAEAYSIVWGPMVDSWCYSEAWGGGMWGSRTETDEGSTRSDADSYYDYGYGRGQSEARITQADTWGYGSDSDLPAAGGYWSRAEIGRSFRVVGGSGDVDVSLTGWTSQEAWSFHFLDATAGWSFGMDGISEIGESWGPDHSVWSDHAWEWTGSLEYGRAYVARGVTWSGVSGGSGFSTLRLDAPTEAQPVPEPASLLLLGLGLIPLLRRRMRR